MTALRLTVDGGRARTDLSPEGIFAALAGIEAEGDGFAILERPAVPGFFVQAAFGGGTWVVESRQGSEDDHHEAVAPDVATVARAFVGWGWSDPTWGDALEWTPLDG